MSAGADTQRQKGEGEGPGSGVWSGKAPGVEGGTRMKTKEMRGGAVQGSERTPRGVGPGGEPPRDGVVGVVDLRFRMPGSLGETGGEWRRSLGGAWRRRRWETGPGQEEGRVQWPGAAESGGAVRPAREPK